MSARPDDATTEAARWLRYAVEDLGAGRVLAESGAPRRQVCAMAQQAAEKALKAGLVVVGIDPPKTHNLGRLRNMLPDEWSVRSHPAKLGVLTEWAVASRYPGDWEEPTAEDVTVAMGLATELVDVMTTDLGARGVRLEDATE